MSLDVQTVLYILSLLGKRGVMRVNKISYVVLSGLTWASQKYIKHECHQQLILVRGSRKVSN